jgi:Secretion system C-terminal sorting domain/Fibronectin type III domain
MKKLKQMAIAFIMMLGIANKTNAQCGTPTDLSAIVVNATTTTLNWASVAGAQSYSLEIQNATGNNVPYLFTTSVTANTYNLAGLTAGANYKFKVRAVCSGNNSSWSSYFFLTSGAGQTQCSTPTLLSVSNVTGTSATLNWNVTAGTASQYRIQVENGSGNPILFAVALTSTTNNVTVTGLTAARVFKFKVKKVCSGITSGWSPWFNFSTSGGSLQCSTPTILSVTNTTPSTATLNWNTTSGTASNFQVVVESGSGNPIPYSVIVNVTGSPFVFTGLNASSNYKFKVKKICGSVRSGWSPWFNFSTTTFANNGNPSRMANISSSEELTIFPNPATDYINVKLSLNEMEVMEEIQICDVSGRLIFSKLISADEQESIQIISTENISPGICLLMVRTNQKSVLKRISVTK